MTDPSQPSDAEIEPASLRFLRRLVTVLTVVMIGGVLVMIAIFVTRFYGPNRIAYPDLPNTITLPSDAQSRAVTFGDGWVAIVTTDNQILIYDAQTGDLRQTVALD